MAMPEDLSGLEAARVREHELLLDELKARAWHKASAFVRDGIIDLERWNISKPKLLFLLKEAHSRPGEPDWDFRKWVKQQGGPRGPMGWAMARFAHVVADLGKETVAPYGDLLAGHNECREAFLASAVVNIKKSHGTTSSSDE